MPNKIFVYGTLRRGCVANSLFGVEEDAEYVTTTTLPGSLYDLGAFPGYKPGETGQVLGDVYELRDRSLIRRLDNYEGFDIMDPNNSLYIRQAMVAADGSEVFVYVYNQDVGSRPKIDSGDWLA